MIINKNYNEKELTMEVKESIDTVNAPDFQNEIMDEMGKFDSLIIDFKELEYISSSGLRVLIMIDKQLEPQNIPFVIKNLNDTIREIFEISGFDNLLTVEL